MRLALKVLLAVVCLLFVGIWYQRYTLKQRSGGAKDIFYDSTGTHLSSGYFKEDTTGRLFFLVAQIARVYLKDDDVVIDVRVKHNDKEVKVPITVVGQGKQTRQFLKVQQDRQFLPNQGVNTIELNQQNSREILESYQDQVVTLALWMNYQDALDAGSDPAIAADLRCNYAFFEQLNNPQPFALDCAPWVTTIYVVEQ